jgi:hypothetical protein
LSTKAVGHEWRELAVQRRTSDGLDCQLNSKLLPLVYGLLSSRSAALVHQLEAPWISF